MQTRCGKIGDMGEDVGEPGLGIDVVEATGGDHRQHDGGTVGATLAAGEGPVAPSQCDTSQCALSTIVGQADPAIVEEAGEVVPAPEHVIHGLQDRGGAREGLALAEQPDVHVLEKRPALFLAHRAPLVRAAAVDGALDLEQRIEASDRLQRDRGDGFALLAFPGVFLDVGQLEEASPRMGQAKRRCDRQYLLERIEQWLEAVVAIGLQDTGEGGQMLLGMLASSVARGVIDRRRRRRLRRRGLRGKLILARRGDEFFSRRSKRPTYRQAEPPDPSGPPSGGPLPRTPQIRSGAPRRPISAVLKLPGAEVAKKRCRERSGLLSSL